VRQRDNAKEPYGTENDSLCKMSQGSRIPDLRFKILAAVYEILSKMPFGYVSKSELVAKINASDSDMEGAIKYLEETGFLHVQWTSANLFAKITSDGVDELERVGLIASEASAKNKEVQKRILQILYEFYSKDPQPFVSSEKIIPDCGFQENEVLSAVRYLKDKSHIEAEWLSAGNFIARISARGIDSLEAAKREKVRPLSGEPARRRLTPAQQKDIVMRAGKCMACGETDIRVLEVHHIKPFAKGGSNSLWNLSVLCPNCHKKAQKGLLAPSALAPKPLRQPKKAKGPL